MTDQEILEAQERLLRRRQELMDDQQSTRKETAYPSGDPKIYPLSQRRTESKTLTEQNKSLKQSVRVEYLRGICSGRIMRVDLKYVQHVVDRGFARIIEYLD